MRKLLFVLSLVILFSCSSSSDDDNSSNLFNPPSWIQGTWKDGLSLGYRFSSNDFCLLASSLETCHRQTLEHFQKSGASVNVDEDISENEYKFSYTIQGQTSYYHFKKITNTKIELVNPVQGQPNTALTKQ